MAITRIIAEYFNRKAWLFGLYARGEEIPQSDVDILVEFGHSRPTGLWGNARMWRELKERLGREVYLVEEGSLKPFAVSSANRDKQLAYERGTTPPVRFSYRKPIPTISLC